MISSKHASVVGLVAVLGLAVVQGCSSDSDGDDDGVTPVAGSSGSPIGTSGSSSFSGGGSTNTVAGASAAGSSDGGSSSAGAPAAGVTAGGTGGTTGVAGSAPTGGGGISTGGRAGAGAGGRAGAGMGGGSGGGGGKAGGGAGAGGGTSTTPSFAEVRTIFGAKCGVGACHNATTGQLNFQTPAAGLYSVLTSPVPATGVAHCNGSSIVVKGSADSFLVKVVSAAAMCMKNGTNETVNRMPNNCNGNGCLTPAQITTITNWVVGGAPN